MKHNFERYLPDWERQRKTNFRALFFFLLLITLALYVCVRAADAEPLSGPTTLPKLSEPSLPTQPVNASATPVESPKSTPPEAVAAPLTGVKGFKARVGAFSDVECGSNWCDRHEPKDGQIALNYAKFGRASKVYIPAFDKTYRVVGATYCGEDCVPYDAEIWFGPDRHAALEFGEKDLLINVIP